MFCNPNFINKKKVRFSPFVRVFPNNTFIERQHIPYLWWSELDKLYASSTMNREIQNLQKNHPTITMRQAMKLLYQPDNLTRYDANNFII
jgi:hypothetical protein